MIHLYNNYKSTGKWDKHNADHNKVLVVLDTPLKQEHAKNKNIPFNSTSSKTKSAATEPGNYTGLPA